MSGDAFLITDLGAVLNVVLDLALRTTRCETTAVTADVDALETFNVTLFRASEEANQTQKH